MSYASILGERLLESRIVFLDSIIDSESANLIIKLLRFYDSENTNPIQLYINSPGGEVSHGLAIIDTMNMLESNVNTCVIGSACSMAANILISGKERIASKNAVVMFHEIRTGAGEYTRISDFRENYKYSEYLASTLADIVVNKTKIGNRIDNGHNLWIWGNNLLKYGVVDKIV